MAGSALLAHRHMHPHLISGWGHHGAQLVELAGLLLVGWGWFLRAGCRCPGNHLGGTWQHQEEAERQNSTTALAVKPALHAGSSAQKRSQNCAALISILTHSLTHSASLTYSTSSLQLSSALLNPA